MIEEYAKSLYERDIELFYKQFENASIDIERYEYWSAREFKILLECTDWEIFLKAIKKAKELCINENKKLSEHFIEVSKTIVIGKNKQSKIKDIFLSRYACYLISIALDSNAIRAMFAKAYFIFKVEGKYKRIFTNMRDVKFKAQNMIMED
jgi:DNA-damage-inducible protein D